MFSFFKKCTELKEHFGTSVTDSILCRSETNIRAVKITLKKIDKETTLKRSLEKAPLVADIETSVGWTKLWDAAPDLGKKHTRGLQALSRVIGHHGHGVKPCPMCDVPGPLAYLLDHVLKDHWEILELGNHLVTRKSLLTLVGDCSISFVSKFRRLFSLNTRHVN